MSTGATGDAKNVLVDVWLVSTVTRRLLDEQLRDSPLSPDEFAVYGLLVDLAPVTSTDLAAWTGLAPTTLSSLLRRCTDRGELARVPNPADRRSTHLALTDTGWQVYRAALPVLGSLLQRVHEELATPGETRRALERLDDALRVVAGLAARPYRLASLPRAQDLAYEGEPLTPAQVGEVARFVDWVRHRDREEAGGTP